MIREAQVDDIALLPDIERAAGAAFRDVGMAAIADDEPLSINHLFSYQDGGRAWVATDELDHPIAYLLLDILDDSAHIEQVSVHPKQARQGLGRALIDTAAAWACQSGLPTLTLTTFTDVPWNAPYYARLGFDVIPDSELSPRLRGLREHEAAIGLDVWPRVAMRRLVSRTAPAR